MSGQVLMTGISGKTLTEDEKNFIQEHNIGGIIFFAKNYESPEQLAKLVNDIQTLREEYPLFISVDQEGGRVQRFKEGFSRIPPMLKVAEKTSPKLCFEIHSAIADELLSCGINLNYNPVCDILTKEDNIAIGDRAFGRDQENVSKFISAVIRASQTKKLLSCAKHFPGHGETNVDSHEDLPVIDLEISEILEREILPFKKAVKSKVDFVMMAHILFRKLDSDLPCTLSPKAYKFLREELKFSKIVITDDMEMGALTKNYSFEEAAVMALNAGADMLIYRNMEIAKVALLGIKEALKKKELKSSFFNEKVERINEVKKRTLSDYRPLYIPDIKNQMKVMEHKKLFDQI